MDNNYPTVADYAWSSAQDANSKAKALERRVDDLEGQVRNLTDLVKDLQRKLYAQSNPRYSY